MTRAEEIFWARVEKTPTCWLWRGRINPAGHGQACIEGQQMTAHRMAWVLTSGVVPSSTEAVIRTCGNALCVRPDHLTLGKRGTRRAKLTWEIVREIRRLAAEPGSKRHQRDLALLFNVSQVTISMLLRGRIWQEAEASYVAPTYRPRRLKRRDLPLVRQLHAEGVPYEEIARRYNVSLATIEHAVTKPPSGEP